MNEKTDEQKMAQAEAHADAIRELQIAAAAYGAALDLDAKQMAQALVMAGILRTVAYIQASPALGPDALATLDEIRQLLEESRANMVAMIAAAGVAAVPAAPVDEIAEERALCNRDALAMIAAARAHGVANGRNPVDMGAALVMAGLSLWTEQAMGDPSPETARFVLAAFDGFSGTAHETLGPKARGGPLQ